MMDLSRLTVPLAATSKTRFAEGSGASPALRELACEDLDAGQIRAGEAPLPRSLRSSFL